jgi:hypothetical protein
MCVAWRVALCPSGMAVASLIFVNVLQGRNGAMLIGVVTPPGVMVCINLTRSRSASRQVHLAQRPARNCFDCELLRAPTYRCLGYLHRAAIKYRARW